MKLRWSSLAIGRAGEIVDYIARDRPQAALAWIGGLEERVESFTALPDHGHAVPEWSEPSMRQIMYGQYRIIYELRDDTVEIMTVKHGRQRMRSMRQELGGPDQGPRASRPRSASFG